MGYGIKGRNRILRSVSQKKIKLDKNPPEVREGSEGSRTIRKTSKGLFDFIKVGNKWFASRFNERPLSLLEDINRNVPNISFRDHKTDIFGDLVVKGKAPEISIVADGTEDSTVQFGNGNTNWQIGIDTSDTTGTGSTSVFKITNQFQFGETGVDGSTPSGYDVLMLDNNGNMHLFNGHTDENPSAIKWYDTNHSHYTGLKAHATTTTSTDYILPAAPPASDKVLQSDSSSNLTWVSQSGGADGMGDGFEVSGDSGSNQTISTNNTLTIAGGTNCASVASATDTITINVDDAFLKNDASDTTTGTITAGGFTTTGTWTFDTSAGGTTGITSINVGTSFTDNDTTLMSSGAIKEKIEDYGYTTNAGDITGVDLTGGTGISIDSETGTGSGNYSSTITCNLEGTEVASTGEGGGTKFLRENGSGGSSWEDAPAVNTANIKTALNGDFSGDFTIGTQSDDLCTFTGQIKIDNNDQNNNFNVNSGGTGGGGGTRTSSVQLGNGSTNWYLKNVGGNIASSGTLQIFDDTTSLFTMARWDYGGGSQFKPVNPPTSSTDDVGFEVEAQSLNQASAGGSDKYTVMKGNYTVTGDGVAGWDTVNLIDLQAVGTSKFTVNNSGNVVSTGTLTSSAGVCAGPNKWILSMNARVYNRYNYWFYPTFSWGTQAENWNSTRNQSSLESTWFDSWNPQLVIPVNMTLTEYYMYGNSTSSQTIDHALMHGTGVTWDDTNADNFSLAQIGATQSGSWTAGRYNKLGQTGLSHSLTAGDMIMPAFRRSTDALSSTYTYLEICWVAICTID